MVQSRLSSTRLPAKAMLDVAGMPLVVLAARRAANTGLEVVVATSHEPEDDIVASAAGAAGLGVFRGPLDDTLARFIGATADLRPTDVVVRFTADNCLPDGSLAMELAAQVGDATPYVYVGGTDRSVPYGVAGEAFTVSSLREAGRRAARREEREHVTTWIRDNLGMSRLRIDDTRPNWSRSRATVDTFHDYEIIARLFTETSDPVGVPWRELADALSAPMTSVPWLGSRDTIDDLRTHDSRLTLGGAQLGMQYGVANHGPVPTPLSTRDLLVAAAKVGISHVDTAAAYGSSEANIGAALARGLPQPMKVVTKIQPLDRLETAAAPEHAAAEVRASFHESLHRLRVPAVDTLLAHRATDFWRRGVRSALLELKAAGLVKRVGVSLSSPHQLCEILSDPEISYVQLPFNLLDARWTEPSVRRAIDARPDVVVATRSAFLQGLLVGGAHTRWPKNFGYGRESFVAAVDRAARDFGFSSRVELALAYVLAQEWISTVVVGADSPQQLYASAQIATRASGLNADDWRAMLHGLPALGDTAIDPSLWEF